MNKIYEQKIEKLILSYDKLYLYSADPGATAVLKPLHSIAQRKRKFVNWFVEGWAKGANLPASVCLETDNFRMPQFASSSRVAMFMGQQVEFDRAYNRLSQFKESGFETIFISDHWKEINKSFKLSDNHNLILPDLFLVPDELAYKIQKNSLEQLGASKVQISKMLRRFVHLGLINSIQKIESLKKADAKFIKDKYEIYDSERIIVMMLDCILPEEKKKIGFDWRTSLQLAIEHFSLNEPEAQLLVKPHPRQSRLDVENFVLSYSSNKKIKVVEEKDPEPFVLIANEVWGITSILLVLALKVDKPIKSFMPNRTELGKRESNEHIEPFVIT